MREIKIQDIDFTLEYEGYYWYSNAPKPQNVKKVTFSENLFTKLPFIIEGNLYSEDKGISINIKNIDGKYRVYEFQTSDLMESNITKSELLAHDLGEVKKIKVIQYWEETEGDPLLEGMKTLQPIWQAFVGFIYN